MNDTPSKSVKAKTGSPVRKTHVELKAERLQAALRENLRRRKAAALPAEAKDTPYNENPGQNDV